jgi:exonuclease III
MGKNSLTNSSRPEQTDIKCLQVNLQHSRAATANLMRTIAEEGIDIVFIQEPYIIQNKVIGISKKYKTYTGPEGRRRAAIVVANNKLDTTLIQQLSDADVVTVEITIGNLNIIMVSMYFDREKPIQPDLAKMELTIQHAKGTAVLFATDSNARSTLWHDKFTNSRGRILEEFLTSNQLYIVNKDSNNTTFRNSLGTSNIDLTIISTQLLNHVTGWTICDQESISDHNFIKFDIKQSRDTWHSEIIPKLRYKTNKESCTKFVANLHRILKTEFQIQRNDTSEEDLDDTLCSLMNKHRCGKMHRRLQRDYNNGMQSIL